MIIIISKFSENILCARHCWFLLSSNPTYNLGVIIFLFLEEQVEAEGS